MEQKSLFDDRDLKSPLASRLRPKMLEEVAGQKHLLGDCLLYTSGSATTPDAGGSTGSEAAGAVKIGLHYELTGEVADYGKAELNLSLIHISPDGD